MRWADQSHERDRRRYHLTVTCADLPFFNFIDSAGSRSDASGTRAPKRMQRSPCFYHQPVRQTIVRQYTFAWSPSCDFLPLRRTIPWPSRDRDRRVGKAVTESVGITESSLIAADAGDQAKDVLIIKRGEALLADIPQWFALW